MFMSSIEENIDFARNRYSKLTANYVFKFIYFFRVFFFLPSDLWACSIVFAFISNGTYSKVGWFNECEEERVFFLLFFVQLFYLWFKFFLQVFELISPMSVCGGRERESDSRMFGFLWCVKVTHAQKIINIFHALDITLQTKLKEMCSLLFFSPEKLTFSKKQNTKINKNPLLCERSNIFDGFSLQSRRSNWLFRGKSTLKLLKMKETLFRSKCPTNLSQRTHNKISSNSLKLHKKRPHDKQTNRSTMCVPNRYDFDWFVLLSVCTSSLIK